MNTHPMRKEKVPLKVKKLNVLIVENWDIILKIVDSCPIGVSAGAP